MSGNEFLERVMKNSQNEMKEDMNQILKEIRAMPLDSRDQIICDLQELCENPTDYHYCTNEKIFLHSQSNRQLDIPSKMAFQWVKVMSKMVSTQRRLNYYADVNETLETGTTTNTSETTAQSTSDRTFEDKLEKGEKGEMGLFMEGECSNKCTRQKKNWIKARLPRAQRDIEVSYPKFVQKFDWICLGCCNINFNQRKECRKCTKMQSHSDIVLI